MNGQYVLTPQSGVEIERNGVISISRAEAIDSPVRSGKGEIDIPPAMTKAAEAVSCLHFFLDIKYRQAPTPASAATTTTAIKAMGSPSSGVSSVLPVPVAGISSATVT